MITKTMQILLSTDFGVGEIVSPKVNDYCQEQLYYMVIGYDIMSVDETGMVTNYMVKVIGALGEILFFTPNSIRLSNDKP